MGCPACAASPPPPNTQTIGPNEQARLEAIARGLPDGLECERRAWQTWRDARQETRHNRKLSSFCVGRASEIIGGKLTVRVTERTDGGELDRDATTEEAEDQAREWLKLAATFNAHVNKTLDIQTKAEKMGLTPASLRDSDAALDQRNREGVLSKRRGRN